MTVISNLIRKTFNLDEPANILSMFYNGEFETALAKTGHNIYGNLDWSLFKWNGYTLFDKPSNIHFINENIIGATNNLEFDFVLCNDRREQHDYALRFSRAMHLPLLVVDHSDASHLTSEMYLNMLQKPYHKVVSSAVGLEDTWKTFDVPVIPYGIEIPEKGSPEKFTDGVICGEFIANDFEVIKQILNSCERNLKKVKVIGNNEGLPKPAGTLAELHEEFFQTKVFINLSNHGGLSFSMLEAMACGCPVVSNETPFLRQVFKDSIIFSKSINDLMVNFCKLCDNPIMRNELGNQARQYIIDNFSMDNFVSKWKKEIENMRSRTYVL